MELLKYITQYNQVLPELMGSLCIGAAAVLWPKNKFADSKIDSECIILVHHFNLWMATDVCFVNKSN